MQKVLTVSLLLLLIGCSVLATHKLNDQYGTPDPAKFDTPKTHQTIDYTRDIEPILERRCVVCHACYDAPCQLKTTAFEGIARGASKQQVYHMDRLLAAAPTRLFEDAHSTREWRKKSFFPVLNERDDTVAANLEASTMAQMLLLKAKHPLPDAPRVDDSLSLGIYRDEQCPSIEELNGFAKDYPLWGMPYALPGLDPQEQSALLNWLGEGAPYNGRPEISAPVKNKVQEWEAFLNQDSLKAQLVARYIYEHLFLAHLHFESSAPYTFFQLVRSTTPPGMPVERISTRRPFDSPGASRVYYRLLPARESIVAKTHMPYQLSDERMTRWQEDFFNDNYSVTTLPSYDPQTASNPFITFAQLPSYARYRFLLEEAQYTIMGFIKGPVCRGQAALNVINDHFWVVFISPQFRKGLEQSEFMSDALQVLQLPATEQSNAMPWRWLKYADEEEQYLKAKSKFLKENVQDKIPVDLSFVWDGNGNNPNAALTIFRHSDSASVVKGLLGETPQTAWIISYPLLERIHYLLVAGYDVFGNVGVQLNSRIYMDFLRMEGEYNFLTLLPEPEREATRRHWYRGDTNKLKEYVYEHGNEFALHTDIKYKTADPLTELYAMLKQRLQPVLSQRYLLQHGFTDVSTQKNFADIASIRGKAAAILPQTSVIRIHNGVEEHYYTLLSNNAYSNISEIFDEQDRRLPEEDTLTLAYGIIGAYPNVIMDVPLPQLPAFSQRLAALSDEAHYQLLLDDFGIRRTNPKFWQYSDAVHSWYFARYPRDAGWLDYNRLENR